MSASKVEQVQTPRTSSADKLLQRLEWLPNDCSGKMTCPVCGSTKRDGHYPECEMAKVLGKE